MLLSNLSHQFFIFQWLSVHNPRQRITEDVSFRHFVNSQRCHAGGCVWGKTWGMVRIPFQEINKL